MSERPDLDPQPTDQAPEPYRVSVVCWGNICRSPMGEFLLREAFEDAGLGDRVVVDSAGTTPRSSATACTRAPRRCCAATGTATPAGATTSPAASSDLVRRATTSCCPSTTSTSSGSSASPATTPTAPSVRLFRSFDPDAVAAGELGMDDPWYGTDPAYDQTYAEITAAVPGIVEHVRAELEARERR